MKAALLASAALGSLLVAATPARRAIPNTRIGVPVAALDPDTSDSSYAAVYKLQIVQKSEADQSLTVERRFDTDSTHAPYDGCAVTVRDDKLGCFPEQTENQVYQTTTKGTQHIKLTTKTGRLVLKPFDPSVPPVINQNPETDVKVTKRIVIPPEAPRELALEALIPPIGAQTHPERVTFNLEDMPAEQRFGREPGSSLTVADSTGHWRVMKYGTKSGYQLEWIEDADNDNDSTVYVIATKLNEMSPPTALTRRKRAAAHSSA